MSHHVLRHEFIQRYRIAANPFEHTHARRDPQESGELLRRGLAAMVTHRTDRRMLIFGERRKC